MGILDGIVEWIAEQVMYGLDLINTSVLGALGCDMTTFLRYFPAAETMYNIFVALAIGMILLNRIWQLFKNYGLVAGVEAEDPVKLAIRSVLFILLAYFADEIVELILKIGGTPYTWEFYYLPSHILQPAMRRCCVLAHAPAYIVRLPACPLGCRANPEARCQCPPV